MPIPNIPNEILHNILLSLDRNEIEKCQLICQKWLQLVDTFVDTLPLYKISVMVLEEEILSPSTLYMPNIIHVHVTLGRNFPLLSFDGKPHERDENVQESETPFKIHEIDQARIKALKCCVVEKCSNITTDLGNVEKAFSKLFEVGGQKITILNYQANEDLETFSKLTSNYINVKEKLKSTFEVNKFDEDNFFTNPPEIPTPPEKISLTLEIFQSNIYDQDLQKLTNLKLVEPQRYSLAFPWIHVSVDFFKNLAEFYLEANLTTLVNTMKFRNFYAGEFSDHDEQMGMAIKSFVEFLEGRKCPKFSINLAEYRCKKEAFGSFAKLKCPHRKDVYELKRTSKHVIQVQFFTDNDDFTCYVKFVVIIL